MTDDIKPILLSKAAEAPAWLVGGKAAALARMCELGLPVPPAFALPTSLCAPIVANDAEALAALRRALAEGVAALETLTGKRFGDIRSPLCLSVRSGAERSMPGMLDTLLDVGLNRESLHGLIRQSGDVRLAFDCYRRFVFSYAETVAGAAAENFDAALGRMLRDEGVAGEAELDSEAMERLANEYYSIAERLEAAPPADPLEQLMASARAVYQSWESARAREYRRLNGLDGMIGTAVTVQAMVFGNAGANSGAGVAFSRDPGGGAKTLYVDFLSDAQGEDVVSGRRTPGDAAELWRRMPEVARELERGASLLEKSYADVQDIEFTVEGGRLYFLQTRAAKRTPRAALRIAVEMAEEGLIDQQEALRRIEAVDLKAARQRRFASEASPVAKAVAASPGVACGRACFSSRRAIEISQTGEPVILVRRDTSTEDVAGFAAASGILTAIGGRTAHAAVVARQLGKVCLVGCGELAIAGDERSAQLGGVALHEGDWLSLDGAAGEIALGRREILDEEAPEMATIRDWRRS